MPEILWRHNKGRARKEDQENVAKLRTGCSGRPVDDQVCNGYPEVQIFKETVINIQQAIGGLWMSSLRRSSPPGSMTPTGLKELPMLYASTKTPRTGYRAKYWR